MPITKERKILIAVAGVACTVFLADRVLMGGSLSGPAEASASPGMTAAPGNLAATVSTDAASPATSGPMADADFTVELLTAADTRPSLAQRLSQAGRALPTDTPDAFTPSSHWQAPAAPEARPEAAAPFDARGFANRHRLDAVFVGKASSYAMIAGQTIRVGDSREGMTLAEVGDRWVVWAGHGVRVKVHLDPRR